MKEVTIVYEIGDNLKDFLLVFMKDFKNVNSLEAYTEGCSVLKTIFEKMAINPNKKVDITKIPEIQKYLKDYFKE